MESKSEEFGVCGHQSSIVDSCAIDSTKNCQLGSCAKIANSNLTIVGTECKAKSMLTPRVHSRSQVSCVTGVNETEGGNARNLSSLTNPTPDCDPTGLPVNLTNLRRTPIEPRHALILAHSTPTHPPAVLVASTQKMSSQHTNQRTFLQTRENNKTPDEPAPEYDSSSQDTVQNDCATNTEKTQIQNKQNMLNELAHSKQKCVRTPHKARENLWQLDENKEREAGRYSDHSANTFFRHSHTMNLTANHGRAIAALMPHSNAAGTPDQKLVRAYSDSVVSSRLPNASADTKITSPNTVDQGSMAQCVKDLMDSYDDDNLEHFDICNYD